MAAAGDRRQARLIGLIVFLATAMLLGLASWLEPSARGFGTHEQLGLGGCVMLTHLGVPCPMCGMTTTFALMMDMRWVDGVLNQPMGAVFWALTFAMAGTGLAELLWPRSRWNRLFAWADHRAMPLIFALLLGLFAGWAIKVVQVTGMSSLIS